MSESNMENIDKDKLRLEERRLELEEARLKLEQSFSKKYATPLVSFLAAIVAGVFALVQVIVASIHKDKELESARILKDKELEIARIERDRRWKLDIADFVFKNRDSIFSAKKTEEQSRIFSVIAVTFPPDITEVLLKNVDVALAQQQSLSVGSARQLVSKLAVVTNKYVHPSGYFEKQGDSWIEYPPYAPGKNIEFQEWRRDSDYVYLVDRTRPKDGDPMKPMYLRIPINGGWVQWTYANPLQWVDLYIVKPV